MESPPKCRMDPLLMTLLSCLLSGRILPLGAGGGVCHGPSPADLDKIFRTGHPDARRGPLDAQ